MSKKAELIKKDIILITIDSDYKYKIEKHDECYETDENYSIRTGVDKRIYYLNKNQDTYIANNYAITTNPKCVSEIKLKMKDGLINYWNKMLHINVQQSGKILNRINNVQQKLI